MMDLSQLSTLNLPLNTLVMFGLYFILGAYAIFSAILYYHWQAYGTDTKVTGLTLILYFSSTIPLLIIMSIIAFTI